MPKNRRSTRVASSSIDAEGKVLKGINRDWFNVKDACDYLQVSRQTLYNLMDRGVLAYTEVIGVRGRRIKKEDLDKLVRQGGATED